MGVAIIFVISLFVYFLPTTFAEVRKHTKTSSIFVINLFLGWTLIGWVICLAWSLSENNNKKV